MPALTSTTSCEGTRVASLQQWDLGITSLDSLEDFGLSKHSGLIHTINAMRRQDPILGVSGQGWSTHLPLYVFLVSMPTFSPLGSRSSNGMIVCVCVRVPACERERVWNELEMCTTLTYPHISSFRTMPVYTHKHIHIPFVDSEPTGLKVVINHNQRLINISEVSAFAYRN